MSTDFLLGLRTAFTAMAQVKGVIPHHVIEAVAGAGTTVEALGNPPELLALIQLIETANKHHQDYVESLPADSEWRRGV